MPVGRLPDHPTSGYPGLRLSLDRGWSLHPNAQIIHDLYSAFARRDHEGMSRCYRDDATFSDPVFRHLDADELRAMWRMFCVRGTDLVVAFDGVRADDRSGAARWEATYTFAATRRAVHNRIGASFEFRDGGIFRHTDSFDFYRWSRMALGPVGWALGWTPFLQSKVRGQAAAQLAAFRAEEGNHG